jgi:hypothetical protein
MHRGGTDPLLKLIFLRVLLPKKNAGRLGRVRGCPRRASYSRAWTTNAGALLRRTASAVTRSTRGGHRRRDGSPAAAARAAMAHADALAHTHSLNASAALQLSGARGGGGPPTLSECAAVLRPDLSSAAIAKPDNNCRRPFPALTRVLMVPYEPWQSLTPRSPRRHAGPDGGGVEYRRRRPTLRYRHRHPPRPRCASAPQSRQASHWMALAQTVDGRERYVTGSETNWIVPRVQSSGKTSAPSTLSRAASSTRGRRHGLPRSVVPRHS